MFGARHAPALLRFDHNSNRAPQILQDDHTNCRMETILDIMSTEKKLIFK
jgi:hypothetical protein